MHSLQRKAMIGLFILQFAVGVAGLVYLHFFRPDPIAEISLLVGLPLTLILLVVYLRGWEPARHVNLLLVSAAVALGFIHPLTAIGFSPTVFIPPALALVFADRRWVIGTAVGVLAVLIVRAGGQSIYARPDHLFATALIVGCLVAGRTIFDYAYRIAIAHAAAAEAERARVAEQAAELSRRTAELEAHTAEQQRLLDLVASLETPAVTLDDGVLLAPIVGQLDSQRAELLTAGLLQKVQRERIRFVVLDIAGSAVVDSSVAQALLKLTHALQLLGCRVALSGISAAVAILLTDTRHQLSSLVTVRSPQEALAHYYHTSGRALHLVER